MRFVLILLTLLCGSASLVKAQGRPTAKLYLFDPRPTLQLITSSAKTLPLNSGFKVGYVLLETELDSLGFTDPSGQVIYLTLEPGKSYYYGYQRPSPVCKEMSSNAFWLSVAAAGRYHHHYLIDKQLGIKKVD